jgi:CelD/BcsL family acetyltransferase involved in cellulose biosynthesis
MQRAATPRKSLPTGGSSGQSTGRILSVRVVKHVEALAPHVSALEELCASALEPNVFFEPWMLLPAIGAFGKGLDLRLVLVFSSEQGRTSQASLCGLFPLVRQRSYKGLPASVLRIWLHRHCFLGTPLLRAQDAKETLATFFQWAADDPEGSALVEFPLIPGEGPFHQHLVDACRALSRPSFIVDAFTRALLRRTGSGDEYVRTFLSGQHRRALERKQRHLGGTNQLTFETFGPGQDLAAWLDEFLRVERDGWKGRTGTALACNEADRDFFRAVATEAAKRNRLLLLALRLQGRAIALRCSFLAGEGSFAFKTAFDEAYAPYSPGAILEMRNIHAVHDLPQTRWMDSCTSPDNFMMNRLWKDRQAIQTVTVATGRTPGDLVVALLPLLRWFKRKFTR